MATQEAPIHGNIKQGLVQGSEEDTLLIMRSMRNTERVFKNKDSLEVQALETKHPGEFDKIQHLMKGLNYKDVFQNTGDVDSGVWSASQAMCMIDDVPTCEMLIEEIVAEAVVAIKGSQACLVE